MAGIGSEFVELEEVDAVRMVWNVWPHSRLEAAKCVVPFGVMYTPAKQLAALQTVEYDPVPCKSCGGVLNPYAAVDFHAKLWTCPFCHTRNHFPPHYQGVSEAAVPAELFPQCSTIEYVLPRPGAVAPPAYVFVIDTSVPEDELSACKTAIAQALTMIPEYALVGLVTFGTHVHVHELGFQECPKAYVFRGTKEYSPAAVADQLGLGNPAARGRQPGGGAGGAGGANRFILPLGECEFVLSAALEDLQKDAFPAVPGQRPSRCTGTALQVASALMGGCLPLGGCAARMLLFLGGPCTEGSGKVVEKDLTEPIRSHKDLAKDAAPHYRKARKYYDGVAAQLVAQGHSLDMYACSLDQVGLAEMKTAVEASGGVTIQTDTFSNPVFKDSLKRMFTPPGEDGHLSLHSNGIIEVHCSRDIRVCGALGAVSGIERKSPLVSDVHVGIGGTTAWKLCSLAPNTSLTIVYDITAQHSSGNHSGGDGYGYGGGGGGGGVQQFFLQFVTKYLHASGTQRCRVTTITRRWVDGGNLAELVQGFDQEAAAVLMARLASYKMETEEDFDATRWLDRSLIRLSARFGDYRKDDPESFQLRPQLAYLPQFLFNFRRSQFIQVFGNSPDETAYSRMLLNRETVSEAMLMIQPTLYAYSFQSEGPEPVLLDVTSISPDRILLLDAYFYVVIFHGTTIAQWRKAGYQDQPEHAAFKSLLEAPRSEANSILARRFPVPRLTDCDQNGSQARFLLAKLNPSATYNTSAAVSSEIIMTDDVSLQVFTEHLKKLAVQS
jgi:protein transport protein SEC23